MVNSQDRKFKGLGLSLLLLVMMMLFPIYAKSSLSELELAFDDYQQAYKHYTSLSTSSNNNGNVQEALDNYRNAYTRYISLKESSEKDVIQLPEKISTLDVTGIDGIVDIDTIIIWKKNSQGVYQLFVTDKNDKTPINISPEYKNYSPYSPINIC